jgi:hypothetical protein
MGEELLQEAFVQRHPEWVKELQIMLKSGEKAEIQVMTVWFRYEFTLSYEFLPSSKRTFLRTAGAQLIWISVYNRAISPPQVVRG